MKREKCQPFSPFTSPNLPQKLSIPALSASTDNISPWRYFTVPKRGRVGCRREGMKVEGRRRSTTTTGTGRHGRAMGGRASEILLSEPNRAI